MKQLDHYFAYLEELATRHRNIGHRPDEKHFFRGDIDEFEDARKRVAHFPAVVALNPLLDTSAQTITNQRIHWRGSLLLLDVVKDKGDAQERTGRETQVLAIARDFMAKMRNDRQRYQLEEKAAVLEGLDLGSFSIELIPHRYPSICGVLFSFVINEPVGLHEPERWDDAPHYTFNP